MKTLAGYLAKNFLSTLAGLYLFLQLGARLKQHPAAILEQATLDQGAAAVLLISAQDPAKFRELLKKVTTPSTADKRVDGSPERND